MTKKIIILMVMLAGFCFSCKKIESNEKNDLIKNVGKKSKRDETLKKQIKTIKNKRIKPLIDILGDTITPKKHVLLLYSGFDCESCVRVGYEMSKKIDSIGGNQIVYIISTSAHIGRDQLEYDYPNYVFNDEKDLIRKDLKFIYTPVFLSLDSENRINNIFYPNYNRNIKEENIFINECIKNYRQ